MQRKRKMKAMRKFLIYSERYRAAFVTAIVMIVSWGTAVASAPSRDYAEVKVKAERFFQFKEWPNAAAMYELMLEDSAKVADTYCHAIVAAAMRDMPDYEMSLMERAQQNLIPVDTIFAGVRRVSFSIGHTSLYENFLNLVKERQPWLKRSIEKQLLGYYIFRRNAPRIIEYSKIMLSGAPGNRQYMYDLAQGYLLDGQTGEGIATFKKILEKHPDDYESLLVLGNYYADNGQDAVALEYLRRAYAIKPTPYVKKLIERIEPPHHRR